MTNFNLKHNSMTTCQLPAERSIAVAFGWNYDIGGSGL
jgi:hypothetical protein